MRKVRRVPGGLSGILRPRHKHKYRPFSDGYKCSDCGYKKFVCKNGHPFGFGTTKKDEFGFLVCKTCLYDTKVGYVGRNVDKCRITNIVKNIAYRKTEKFRRTYLTWAKNNVLKLRAMHAAGSAVSKATRSGFLKRKPCEICNEKAEAHHPSYLKEDRLKVMWLCKLHHEEWHMNNLAVYPSGPTSR